MPRTTRQRRHAVVAALRHIHLITTDDLMAALADSDIESPAAVRSYISQLEDLGYIERTAGGWTLSPASRATGTITIKITPSQATGGVRRALSAALRPFGKITTMEEEHD